jgi:hypothetical protein
MLNPEKTRRMAVLPALSLLLPSGLYRRLRIHTESAIARGLIGQSRITAGGEFHPAPKTAYLFMILL